MIYFIQAGNNAVKIGIAEKIESRLIGLQSANYEKLKVLYVIKGGRKMERRLHFLGRKYRIRGEWFDNRVLECNKIKAIINIEKIEIKLIKKTSKHLKLKINTRMREARKRKGWSIKDVAKKLNVSTLSVHRWETSGEINEENRNKLKELYKK